MLNLLGLLCFKHVYLELWFLLKRIHLSSLELSCHVSKILQCLQMLSILWFGGQNMSNIFLTFHVLHNNSWALLVHKIEIKRIFNMARVIIGFKHYQLGIEILYKLVFLWKTSQMILDLGAQLSLNRPRNTSQLKMRWCGKMKISLLISICLKKIDIMWYFLVLNKIGCIVCEEQIETTYKFHFKIF